MFKKACKARAIIYMRAFSTANTKRKGYRGPSGLGGTDTWCLDKKVWRISYRLEQKDIDVIGGIIRY